MDAARVNDGGCRMSDIQNAYTRNADRFVSVLLDWTPFRFP